MKNIAICLIMAALIADCGANPERFIGTWEATVPMFGFEDEGLYSLTTYIFNADGTYILRMKCASAVDDEQRERIRNDQLRMLDSEADADRYFNEGIDYKDKYIIKGSKILMDEEVYLALNYKFSSNGEILTIENLSLKKKR